MKYQPSDDVEGTRSPPATLQNVLQEAPMGSGKGSAPIVLGAQINFHKIQVLKCSVLTAGMKALPVGKTIEAKVFNPAPPKNTLMATLF